ncbi:MAG TPA: hypothetical protein GX707_06275 [Epulopiscium sp.]|nr:hypothetical protein [Candidatus Epulonipiscium sp.]
MKIYRNSIIITGLVSLVTICLAFLINANSQLAIYYDILIGIFGGAIVTLITSIVSYRIKRLEVLEEFYIHTKEYLREINKYYKSTPSEDKIDFFIRLYDKDLYSLGIAYRDIDFFYDFNKKNKLYVYNKIYFPILELEREIKAHYRNYIYHKDGSGRNLEVMEKYIDEFEQMIYMDNNYNVFFKEITEELGNKYYILMYGKRTYKRMLKEEKGQD